MSRIESYLMRQLLWPALVAAGALLTVALLSQTLATLEVVVKNRQSLGAFATITLLGVPQLAATILPVALFVAALVSLNRLHTEHEIVVCFAGGMSRWRVAAPALRLAAVAALLALAVNLYVGPWCARALRGELHRVQTDLVASLIREGAFSEPSPGLTVYAQSADSGGGLKNVFIHQQQGSGSVAYSAKRGVVTRQLLPDGGERPVLVLFDGSNEQFNDKQVLNQLAFKEDVFDLSPYLRSDEGLAFKKSDRYLHELVAPDLRDPWDRRNRKKYLAEANARIASPLYNLTLMLIALYAVFGGAFSRIGYARRIAVAAVCAVSLRVLGFGAETAAGASTALNVLQYLIPLAPAAWMAWRLFGERSGAAVATAGPRPHLGAQPASA